MSLVAASGGREEAGRCPPGGPGEIGARAIDGCQSDLVAAVENGGLVEQVGRIGLSQLDDSRKRRIVHCGAHGRIRAVAPQWREVLLEERVVQVVPIN